MQDIFKQLGEYFDPSNSTTIKNLDAMQQDKVTSSELPEKLFVVINGLHLAPDPLAPSVGSLDNQSFYYKKKEQKELAAAIVHRYNQHTQMLGALRDSMATLYRLMDFIGENWDERDDLTLSNVAAAIQSAEGNK